MTILWTSTGSVLRADVDADADNYAGEPARTAVASGIRSLIEAPAGSERVAGGSQEVVRYRLRADVDQLRDQGVAALEHTDRWRDDRTGVTYDVEWSHVHDHPSLGHVEAGLLKVTGLA